MVLVCPGSFDPVTLGHTDIIRRAARLCDRLIVAVLTNTGKNPLFTLDQRVSLLQKALPCPGVEVQSFDGLLLDFVRQSGADAILRGVRSALDLEYEKQAAAYYASLEPPLETLLLLSDPAMAHISSSMVREIAGYGGSLKGLVPACIIGDVLERVRTAGR